MAADPAETARIAYIEAYHFAKGCNDRASVQADIRAHEACCDIDPPRKGITKGWSSEAYWTALRISFEAAFAVACVELARMDALVRAAAIEAVGREK